MQYSPMRDVGVADVGAGKELLNNKPQQLQQQQQHWGSRRASLQQLASCREAAGRSRSRSPPVERVERLAASNAVVVFSISSCCMCHVVKKLFCGMGVSPTVVELDEEAGGTEMEKALRKMVGEGPAIPAIFVGGKLVGGLERLMAVHISGDLIPQLKNAGALWL